MTAALLDDHLLLRRLLGDSLGDEGPTGAIATTGLWYHRLCRALANPATIGALSRRLGAVDDAIAALALAAAIDLPPEIELVTLRTLGWPMADLVHRGARLNLLSLEALAAAAHLEAEIWLAVEDDNEPLRSAARDLGVSIRTVAG